MKHLFTWRIMLLCSAVSLFAACDDDDDDDVSSSAAVESEEAESSTSAVTSPFFSATSGESNYVSTVDDLSSGTSTIVGNGLETLTGTEWFTVNGKYLYRLQYNQGNSGGTTAYHLTADGEMEARANSYDIQRFSTFGIYGDYVITSASVSMSETDASGNAKKGISVTYLDTENQTTTNRDVIEAENFLGTGEYVLFSGIEEANGKLYTAIIPQGLSAYGTAYNDGANVIVDEDLMTVDGDAKTVDYTQYPDSCWIAIYDDETMSSPTIVGTDKLSYACGRMRSQYYQTIWAADNGDLYVFSNGYSRGLSVDAAFQTSHTAGVMRILAGETEFDSSYGTDGVVDLEADGHQPFYRCWHMTDDYFLLQLYTTGINYSGSGATKMAVYCGSTQTLTDVTGLPESDIVSSFCKRPFNYDGLTYVTVKVTDGSNPAVYVIDPTTATATKGLEVECSEISCVGILEATEE